MGHSHLSSNSALSRQAFVLQSLAMGSASSVRCRAELNDELSDTFPQATSSVRAAILESVEDVVLTEIVATRSQKSLDGCRSKGRDVGKEADEEEAINVEHPKVR